MYTNPTDSVKLWKDSLDMQTKLDADIIAEYNQKNIDLIESKFNMSLTRYYTGQWQDDLSAWVKSTCPDSY
jgi:hypothetical protein